ncbi:LysR family transcriptional regulator [Paraburkholderia caballeronis]|uniref:DNA-binding transcriptional regulator, LysR family n=1 Tax=Paraburkholderia caballeronis TaxID=416943 RepID=A0A1H7UHU0_9BURK|nr:LysR family transcriptional regulator [Paraburkholderia caballeronis]PXW17512.1 LysR family transcriptional regulator [Paraburkholderia caballeronis]PXW95101.1 LysR family transcriptional regulator [Paraburkholderia caballeronis]RAJ90947.1 LysR family transcriptional regulator [Paraburkholderia caballeronis]TDV26743.1 LysR family transcriptional regulator [Paraburkholderia caballeronis]SEE18635.1 transcriptional regulator, LysR family [Paraburkholderia caballeronis]
MIDRIQAMRTFVRIVDTNSFTKAAQSLDMPRASATTLVQNLEALLNTQLLVRTTRRLSVTPEGAAYYEHCAQILAEIDEMEASMRQTTGLVSGRLRVEMPGVIANAIVLPALDDFHARHPHIDLAIGVSLRNVDLVGEAVDCSIQLGELPDSGLVARRLGVLDHVTCASPAYLERNGMPQTVDDLAHHTAVNCLSPVNGRPVDFDFEIDGGATSVRVDGFVHVADEIAYLTCGLQGYGLIQPARLAAQPYLDSGELREVLPRWKPLPTPVSVAFVKTPRVAPRVRVFVDWLAELFDDASQLNRDLSRVRQLLSGLQPA